MRVAHIITGLAADGAETMLYKLLRAMDRTQFDPLVVSLGDKGAIGAHIEELGIPVFCCGMRPGVPSLAAAFRMVRRLRDFRPDLLQGWMYHGNLAAQMASAFLPGRTPVIWNIRGSHHILREEKPLTAATIWLGARLSRLPVTIINNSLSSARSHDHYLGFAKDRWAILPNGFELEKFAPSDHAREELREELRLPADSLLIGLIGRYHPMKDHTNFLKAAAILHHWVPDVHFVLAGAGVDQDNAELRELVTAFGLEDCLHLLGGRTDAPHVTAALDIAGSASYSEAFPNVIGEAMSCGVPCVVTDVGDSAWVVGDTGFSVPPREPNALSDAWLELIGRGPGGRQTLGAAARIRIASLFSIGAVAAQYAQLYNQVRTGVASKNRHALPGEIGDLAIRGG